MGRGRGEKRHLEENGNHRLGLGQVKGDQFGGEKKRRGVAHTSESSGLSPTFQDAGMVNYPRALKYMEPCPQGHLWGTGPTDSEGGP
ncbi:unnamed protein product [Calypogeia fissa]